MSRLEGSADAAGAAGSIITALCCAGVPAVVGAFTAVGLGFLITDVVLLPVLAAMLALAMWGLARGRSIHGSRGPLTLGAIGAIALTVGVFASRWLLGLGAVLLVLAPLWNIAARRRWATRGRNRPPPGLGLRPAMHHDHTGAEERTERMRTIQLRIEGMTCSECATRVEQALTRVPGVEAASIDYRAGRGTVAVTDTVPESDLLLAVKESGYQAQVAGAASDPGPAAGEGTARRGDSVTDFDLLVIGTGGAGVAAAIQGADLEARVGIAEGGTLGGTCVNVGCIPSKNLIEAAAYYHAARRGFPGIGPCEPALDWPEMIAQKDALVRELRETKYADVLQSYPGIALLEGRARLLGRGRVQVGEAEHRASKIVLATGTSPMSPPIEGLAGVDALDSTTAMELEELPRSMIVLGGSAVGLELGQIFARFGTKVIVLELLPRLLANEDETVSQAIRDHLGQEGLEIHTSVTAFRVERDGREVVIHVRQGGLTGAFRADRLLVATGRRANTADLGLEAAGIRLTAKGFIEVDTTLRTANPDVYAAGDVTGGPGFVYVAAAGGRIAALNALTGVARELELSAVPSVTFTSPQVASVGLTEAKARAAGHHVEISTLDLEHVPRALVSHDRRGLVKVVAEAGTGRVLGVHAVGPHAGELMGEATLAVRLGLTTTDLTSTLHPYLTWVEGLKLAAQGFAMDVSRLSCCA